MRQLVLGVCVFVLYVCAFLLTMPASWHVEAKGLDLVGVYACEGTNPEGKPYRGVAEIIKHDDRFEVRWTFPPDDTALGLGLMTDGRLAVAVFGGPPSIAVFRVTKETPLTLTGVWATITAQGVHHETLTKLPAGHVPPVQPQQQPRKPQQQGTPLAI